MQLDMFSDPGVFNGTPSLTLLEDMSPEYKPRTLKNAREADVTVAFAVDFATAGERLTHRAAGPRYVGIPYGRPVREAATQLEAFLKQKQARSLNVAGNGIYTLNLRRVSQREANQWVYDVLKLATSAVGLRAIRSGGQTGIDTAGLVAALALGIPATGLYPKGFKTRGLDMRDVSNEATTLELMLHSYAAELFQ